MTDIWIWLPAWLAGVLVTLSHVPLGRQVLKRGIIFLDLAVAQAAGFGVVLAYLLGFEHQSFILQSLALFSAMLMVLIVNQLERLRVDHLEAWIGVSFVVIASLTLWLLSGSAQADEQLRHVLTGQILWTTPRDLILLLVFYAIVCVLYVICKQRSFYWGFALCITAAVQLVGVYLVFATLIIPALAVGLKDFKKCGLLIAIPLSVIAYTLGLFFSYYWDAPASPVIVSLLFFQLLVLKSITFLRKECSKQQET